MQQFFYRTTHVCACALCNELKTSWYLKIPEESLSAWPLRVVAVQDRNLKVRLFGNRHISRLMSNIDLTFLLSPLFFHLPLQ